eukprot:789462-Pelagomonas_calceolata.AAC.1
MARPAHPPPWNLACLPSKKFHRKICAWVAGGAWAGTSQKSVEEQVLSLRSRVAKGNPGFLLATLSSLASAMTGFSFCSQAAARYKMSLGDYLDQLQQFDSHGKGNVGDPRKRCEES